MVSAVFHSPGASSPAQKTGMSAASDDVSASESKRTPKYDWRPIWLMVLPPLLGLALLVGVWAMVSMATKGGIPSPYETGQIGRAHV